MTPRAIQALQSVLYSFVMVGTAAAATFFMLGSLDLLTNLAAFTLILCTALVIGGRALVSLRSAQRENREHQISSALAISSLQHKVHDHDLTLIDLTGRIDQLSDDVSALRSRQQYYETQQQTFISRIKEKIAALVAPPAPAAKSAIPIKTPANAMTAPEDPRPQPHDDGDVVISPTLIREAIKVAVLSDRIDLYLQPIATLPTRRTFAYEVYGRLRLQPGLYIPARDYRKVAAADNKLAELDRLVLVELGRHMAQNKIPKAPLFLNLARSSLTDRTVMQALLSLLRSRHGLANRITLDIPQAELASLTSQEIILLKELSRLGVSLALDNITDPHLDLARLGELSFSHIKLPHQRLQPGTRSDQGAEMIARFLTKLRQQRLTLIACGVETESELRQLLDHPIMLAQGYLFGRPDRAVTFAARKAA